ncbi:VTT domain-containing protein [Actinomadura sp. DC4]|uniref:DedA family protein n=1 Tax=Actinomadura sp. DC4 TaxID=3055069 RepID=UPI0025AF838B|nr:VTT domain-containing protein [Actinomadura sp. DC4]MDN3356209.1 VTT domain-containing protein [Actinomadura sp. DC4]
MTTAEDEAPKTEQPAQPGLPWTGRPQRADLICWFGIAASGLYALALIPIRPLLIGHHPILLELLTGSMTSIVTAGAFARIGQAPIALAVLAAVPGMIMFDPFYWWAGRRWGRGMLTIFAGRTRRGHRLVTRAEKYGHRLGWLGVILAYYLPIPAALLFVIAGWTGMRLLTFLLLDTLGALLWISLLTGLGYYLGQDAVNIAKTISHYGLWASIALVIMVIVTQQVKNRRDTTPEPAIPTPDQTPPE